MSIQSLSTFLNVVYIGALVIGAAASAGLVYANNRLQREAGLQIAKANEAAARASERAEQLAQENLEIKRKTAWRTLIGDDRKQFLGSIGGVSGRQVTIVQLQDGEAWTYSEQIFSAFREAGWGAGKNYRQIYDAGGLPQGVICRVASNADSTIQTVLKALETANVHPIVKAEIGLRPDFIEIIVGLRPVK